MAKGRRDYTWGVLQDSIQPGLYSVNFFTKGNATLANGASSWIIDYTVPAGYRLYLTSVHCTTISAQINYLYILKDAVAIMFSYFDLNYTFSPGNWGSYAYETGERLRVNITNYDTETYPFYVEVFGILEQLV